MVVGADGRTGGRTDGRTDRQTDGRTDTQNIGGYNIIPRHFLVAGHKNASDTPKFGNGLVQLTGIKKSISHVWVKD